MIPLRNFNFAGLDQTVGGIGVDAHRSNVLLIEDEAVIALDMANDLESWAYKVIGIAHSMKQALEAAEKCRPELAIVDVKLRSEHDGVEIAEVLKSRFNTQIVFLTAQSDRSTRERIMRLNPMGFLFKPYSSHMLRQLLETYEAE